MITKTETFGDVTGPAVVVGYPMRGRVLVETTLVGEPDPAKVTSAVKKAAGKIDTGAPSKDTPAPRPLIWEH